MGIVPMCVRSFRTTARSFRAAPVRTGRGGPAISHHAHRIWRRQSTGPCLNDGARAAGRTAGLRQQGFLGLEWKREVPQLGATRDMSFLASLIQQSRD